MKGRRVPLVTESLELELVPYDRRCLDLSWKWLNDPEVRHLTMTPPFSRADQEAFFQSLPRRTNYAIWGVTLPDVGIVGATGLKNFRGNLAEYWGYIGEKEFWGRGLGSKMVSCMEAKARELGFEHLDLRVLESNTRAIRLYEKCGFELKREECTGDSLCMEKRGIR